MDLKRKIIGVSVSIAATVLPSVSNSAAPIAYDQFSIDTTAATGAMFNAVCPTGFTCTVTAVDDGFLQRTISDGASSYVQTLMSDKKADMNALYAGQAALSADQMEYVDEIFVSVNGASGSARKTRVAALGAGVADINAAKFVFESHDIRLNGDFWAVTDAAAGLGTEEITQVVSNAQGDGTNATDFFTSFNFQEIATNAGASTADAGKVVQTKQLVGDKAGGKLVMAQTDYQGSKVANYTDGSVNVGGSAVNTTATDSRLNVVWVAQDFSGTGSIGLQTAKAVDAANSRIEGTVLDFTGTGFVGTTAQQGFGWNNSLGTGVYAPSF